MLVSSRARLAGWYCVALMVLEPRITVSVTAAATASAANGSWAVRNSSGMVS